MLLTRVHRLCVIPVLLTLTSYGQESFVLHDGSPVRLRLTRNLSSADAKKGETVDFEVLEDVTVNDVIVIAKGGSAIGTVTQAQAKRRMARGGKLDVNIDYVRSVAGEKVALKAVKETKGGGHTGAMTGAIVATSIVFFPAAPFFLFMHGKDIDIPKGTEITAYVSGETRLDSRSFKPAAQTATTAARSTSISQSSATALTNEEVVSLVKSGLSEDTVIAAVRGTPANYALGAQDLMNLKSAGVSDKIIQAMLEVSKR